MSQLWQFIRLLSGIPKKSMHNFPTLKVGQAIVLDDKEKANELGNYFVKVGKKDKSKDNFKVDGEFKEIVNYLNEEMDQNIELTINEPFKIFELENILQLKNASAPGNDASRRYHV